MVFGITKKDLLDPNIIKIFNGIAGSGKSTATVNALTSYGSNFCLASFSNALKFSASDRFGCNVDTICGLEFINSPYPRYAERPVTEYDTVVNDEILLDGAQCIEWMMHNVGKTNIIALTDSHQMLNAENGAEALKAFKKLIKMPNVIHVEITSTKRACDQDTVDVYNELYAVNSDHLFTVSEVKDMFRCDILSMSDISYDPNNTYICHSNKIEHDVYKKYSLHERRDIPLIPKSHISRKRNVDFSKYPICDQITATDKKIASYLQVANVATPTRFQGKEVDPGHECYFIVESDSIFTGREIYTVATRCKSVKSLHIVITNVDEYKDPKYILNSTIVKPIRLNIPDAPKKYKNVTPAQMAALIKKYGEEGQAYFNEMITSGDNIIYSTLPNRELQRFATITNEEIVLNHNIKHMNRSIRSVTKKDATMHFDFMPRVYDIVKTDINPPRLRNKPRCKKQQFNKLCDIYSAFPTILNYADMPKAGYLYEEYDPELLNFYQYDGDIVSRGSIITEELAKKLGHSKYVFSTSKQSGCELGRYTYNQCKLSKEKKKKINSNFLWGALESNYYERTDVIINGQQQSKYVKHPNNNLELVACALWSKLCLIMIEAIESLGVDEWYVVTDGLYYNGDKYPTLPEWCDYRIEIKDWTEETKGPEKYNNIEYKTYDNLKSETELKREYYREYRRKAKETMTEEQKAEQRAKNAERQRRFREKARQS